MEYFSSLCRLCETEGKQDDNWPDLRSTENEQLEMKLRSCTNIEICRTDNLPKRICNLCTERLEQAYNFKLQCERTNAKLHHEIAFLEKNDWNRDLTIPPFEYNPWARVKDEVVEQSEIAIIKTEPAEGAGPSNEGQCGLSYAGSEEPEIDIPAPLDHLMVNYSDEDDDSIDDQDTSEESEGEGNDSDSVPKNESKKPAIKVKTKKKYRDRKPKTISCEACEEKFSTQTKLIAHSLEAHGKTPFECKVCGKNFTANSHLKNHEILHSGVRQFECTQCDKKYGNYRGLKLHVNTIHSENKPHVCDKCGQRFAQACMLRIHAITHIEERNFKCKECSKGFKTQINLNLHMNMHLPESERKIRKPKVYNKTYECPYCAKTFKTSWNVATHIRTHTGEQPYECDVCFKRFTSYQIHKKHILTHTGEKPHVCEFCQKAFSQKYHLVTHIKGVHQNEKRYPCKLCPEAFVTASCLQHHERREHGPSTVSSMATVVSK